MNQVPEKEDQPNSNTINDLCFSPDGATLVVAVGNRVLIYDGEGGELLHSLRGHKDTVRERLSILYAQAITWLETNLLPHVYLRMITGAPRLSFSWRPCVHLMQNWIPVCLPLIYRGSPAMMYF